MLLVLLLVIVGLAGSCVYLYEKNFYVDHFYPGTTIMGVDASDRTLSSVLREIEKDRVGYELTVSGMAGEDKIDGSMIGMSCDYETPAAELLASQDASKWYKLKKTTNVTIDVPTVYDEEKLREVLQNLPCLQGADEPKDAYIIENAEGLLEIVPEVYGNTFDRETVIREIMILVETDFAALQSKRGGGVMTSAYAVPDEYYDVPQVFADNEELVREVEETNRFRKRCVTIDLDGGAFETLYLSQVAELTEDYEIVISREKIDEYVAWLEETYGTYQTERTFTDVKGRVIKTGGNEKDTFGYWMETEETADTIYADLLDMRTEETSVRASWILAGNGRDEKLADIGDTYIVIDLTTQSLLYVIDGEIFLEESVVSGMDSVPERRTPEGVFCVWGKMEDVDLIGEDYVSRVQYWMPFTYVGEGLHDAPWRSASEFGGTTYLNNGSHGCVNLKPEVAKLLYETIEIGTPVLIYKSKPDEA